MVAPTRGPTIGRRDDPDSRCSDAASFLILFPPTLVHEVGREQHESRRRDDADNNKHCVHIHEC